MPMGRVSTKTFAEQYQEIINRLEDAAAKHESVGAALRKSLRQLKRAPVPINEPSKPA